MSEISRQTHRRQESRPLAGRRIVITRTREQSGTLAVALRAMGAEVVEIPTIRVVPVESYAALDQALSALERYDALLVTSANTVRVLLQRKPLPWTFQPMTVAIGPATAQALRTAALRVDLQPVPAIAESVVEALRAKAAGKRMLLVRAEVARELLPSALRAAGATVDVVDAYRTILAEESAGPLLAAFDHKVDAVAFTSSSTATNFFRLLGAAQASRVLANCAACSIGPVTSETLRGLGISPAAEAENHDVAGLVAVMKQLLSDEAVL